MQGTENFGIGTDIESIDRFRRLNIKNNPFLNRAFTKKEIDYCFSKKEHAHHLAARYCGKEAVVKALNSMGKPSPDYKKVEILNNELGIPLVNISDEGYKNLKVHLSLSHCEDKAIAFAVVIELKNE